MHMSSSENVLKFIPIGTALHRPCAEANAAGCDSSLRTHIFSLGSIMKRKATELGAMSSPCPSKVGCLSAEGLPADSVVYTYIAAQVGFRQDEIRGRQLLHNNQPIMIKGVNRHMHEDRRGKAVTEESMLADIKLLKQFNLNAVRNAHYPNNNRW